MKYYTSIEQSKKLLELGLSPESADMHYILIGNIDSGNISCSDICPLEVGKPYNKLTLSAWSLGALLEVMPRIILNKCDIYGWDLYPVAKNFRLAYIKYGNVNAPDYQEIVFHEVNEKTLIEAVYSMVVWLLKNNHISK